MAHYCLKGNLDEQIGLKLKIFVSLVLIQLQSPTSAQWQYAICSSNFSDRNFQSNLNSLTGSIGLNAQKNNDYFNDTVGEKPNQVYGLIMCYADANRTSCNDCLTSTSTYVEITRRCPDSKTACFWGVVPNSCLIRYSNESFFSVADTTVLWAVNNTNSSKNFELLDNARKTLFGRLIARANTSEKLVASGEENISTTDKLYGLLQCTRDLNHRDCYRCLNTFVEYISQYDTIGVRLHGYSCFLRYETYVFMPTNPPGAAPPRAFAPTHPPSAFIPTDPPGAGTRDSKKSRTTLIVAVVAGVAVAALLVIITICIWFRRKRSLLDCAKSTSALIEELQEVTTLDFFIYNLTTISNATDNFSDKNKLGQGGFGPVYKGTLPSGQEIAVKRLSRSSAQGATEFKNEVDLIVRLKHNNLVQLLGCCISEHERMLCYEYLPNGSLDKILFATDEIKKEVLDWSRRYKILKGICRGLLYLHEESPLKIVHRDLKASNILLDKDMNPKISDFGLARLFDRDQTQHDTNNVVGTFGYIAPEYSLQGTFSDKSDVFSLGILLLEIVMGRKNASFPGNTYTSGLTSHVWKHWSEGKVLELKDPTLEEECIEEVSKCIHVALLCLQVNPSSRPNMEAIANMLNNSSILSLPSLPPPKFIWGADISMFEDDENIASFSMACSILGSGTAKDILLCSSDQSS